ncbi:hypothetical protein SO802_016854 [Lithocarpus litseifolius]|uniref:Uncharacterized protein n=1 Tax=Lithocarpus litseifolius TaxID=425828 RepID=A0AAW2CZU8_9ROSI
MFTIEYREDDVRLSELETGLSSNAESLCKVVDIATSKMTSSSSSPPLHALSEICSLKEKHLNGFRKRFQFPKGTSIRLPHPSEKACSFAHGEVGKPCLTISGGKSQDYYENGKSLHLAPLDRPKLENQHRYQVRAAFAFTCEIEDFDDLVDPRYLFDCCLGPEPSKYTLEKIRQEEKKKRKLGEEKGEVVALPRIQITPSSPTPSLEVTAFTPLLPDQNAKAKLGEVFGTTLPPLWVVLTM